MGVSAFVCVFIYRAIGAIARLLILKCKLLICNGFFQKNTALCMVRTKERLQNTPKPPTSPASRQVVQWVNRATKTACMGFGALGGVLWSGAVSGECGR